MALHLNKETHTYTVDGVVKPAVSDIMRPMSEKYYKQATKYGNMEAARKRGEAIHDAIDYYLTFGIYDKTYFPYIAAFATWMVEHKVQVIENEQSLTNGVYCGTPDILAYVDGKLTLVDIKATSVINQELLEVQLAAYYNLELFNGVRVEETAVLHLKPHKYTYKPIAINLTEWGKLDARFTHKSDVDTQGG